MHRYTYLSLAVISLLTLVFTSLLLLCNDDIGLAVISVEMEISEFEQRPIF